MKMLMSFVSRSYHTPHFLKERETGVIVYIFPYDYTAVYMSLMQKLKELIKLSDLCNFQLDLCKQY